MIAAQITDLAEREPTVTFYGFETTPLLPAPLPPFMVIRQEYDAAENTLHILSCGRLDTFEDAEALLFDIINYYRIDIGWTAQVMSVKPREMLVSDPHSDNSFMLGVNSDQCQHSLN